MPIKKKDPKTPTTYSTRIAMPVPASPLIIEPTPGMKNDTIRLSAGLFGATTIVPG
jgi:hypothetical protein